MKIQAKKRNVYVRRFLTGYIALSFSLVLAHTGFEVLGNAGAVFFPVILGFSSWVLFRKSNINWSDLGISHRESKTGVSFISRHQKTMRFFAKKVVTLNYLRRRWLPKVVSPAHLS
jgi:hypothetical protein